VTGSAEVIGSLVSVLFLYIMPELSEQGVAPGKIYFGVAVLQAIGIPFVW